MDHSTHTRLAARELIPDTLEGATIYDGEDHKIGTVSHLNGIGATAQLVIDVGGFLGIGAKPVAAPVSDLQFMRHEDGDIHAVTDWTKESLKAMPEHKDDMPAS